MGEIEGKRPLGGNQLRWKDNIKGGVKGKGLIYNIRRIFYIISHTHVAEDSVFLNVTLCRWKSVSRCVG